MSTMVVAVLCFMFGYWVRLCYEPGYSGWGKNELQVTGNALVEAPIHYAWINLTVAMGNETNPAVAKIQSDHDVRSITSAVQPFGVLPADIDGSKVFVGRKSEWNNEVQEYQEHGYEARRTLKIRLREVRRLDDLLTLLSTYTSVTTESVEFGTDERDKCFAKALSEAVNDAKKQAQTLTTAAGLTLGRAVSITDMTDVQFVASQMGSSRQEDFDEAHKKSSFTRETVAIPAKVQVTYALIPTETR